MLFHCLFFGGDPPLELLHRCWKLQKKLKNGPVASPDLVTFSASGVHPVYAYYFHPQHGEGYNPLWYDPQLGGTPPIHKRDYVAIFRQNVSRSHLRSPDIQGIPRG